MKVSITRWFAQKNVFLRYVFSLKNIIKTQQILRLLVITYFLMHCQKEKASIQNQNISKTSKVAASIVFLGDSLTDGYKLPSDKTPPAIIKKELEAKKLSYRVINAGRSGDTTEGALSRLDWYLQKAINPKHIIIGLGSNDAMRGSPLQTIEKNLHLIVKQIRKFDPTIKIYLWEMYTFPNLGAKYANGYAQIFKRVATKDKLILLSFPLADVAGKTELNQADGIHPNETGAEILAQKLWEGIQPHL